MKDLNLALYRRLYLIRKAEDAVRKDYFDDKMKTPMHMSAGGEAICVGVCQALRPEDQIMGTYRTHGIYLAKTGETDQFFAEMYGKVTGMAKGKAGSMHLTAPQAGLICTSAIVGTTIPVAIGAAFANKQQKNGRMIAVFFGDGAIDEGVFWESLNAACVMKLPVLFICEDNDIAVHIPGRERHGYRSIHEIVERFDCSVFTSESTDAEIIHDLALDALKSIRETGRPSFMHLKYYRYLEHVGVNEDFKQGYRDRVEYEKWRARDPVELQRAKLLKWCTEDEIRAIESQIEAGIAQSIKKADAAAFASPAELYEDVLGMSRSITYREAIREATAEEMRRDPGVFVYGIDVADHKRIFDSTKGLVEEFGPERCFSTPLSEDAMTGLGMGAAINGMRPIHVHMRVDFLLLGVNQLVNMIATHRYGSGGAMKVPMVIRAIIGRGWGQSYQHSKALHSWFAHIPGLKVVMPSTPRDAKGMLIAAIRDDNPVVFIEHRWLYDAVGEVPEDCSSISLDGARVLRPGKDITVVGTSWMNVEAIRAAQILEKHGVDVEVVDVRSIAPFDGKTIVDSVRKTGHCIVADNDWVHCGFSAEVATTVYEACYKQLKSPVDRIGYEATPCPCTRPLEDEFYPNAIDIIRAVEAKLGLKPIDLSGEDFYSYENKFKGPF